MREILNGKEIMMGTCYYPEHWKREEWQRIFAWNLFESRGEWNCGFEEI